MQSYSHTIHVPTFGPSPLLLLETRAEMATEDYNAMCIFITLVVGSFGLHLSYMFMLWEQVLQQIICSCITSAETQPLEQILRLPVLV